MDEKALFTKFWTKESKTTRNVLARIPEGVRLPPGPALAHGEGDRLADRLRGEDDHRRARDRQGRVGAAADAGDDEGGARRVRAAERARCAQRWNALPAEKWDGTLEFFGRQRPASPMAWSFLFDIVHHRGQITTYLRPMGSTVPQIYGPSGDEP